VSDWFLKGSIASFLLLLLDKKMRPDAGKLFLLYANTQALAYTIYTFSPLGPSYQNRYRPVVYYDTVPDGERGPGNNRNSRYSGHTGNATAAVFFLAKTYSDYHSELSKRDVIGLYSLAVLPSLLQGYLRMKALKHFPSDVLIAVLIGAVCGTSVPEAYRTVENQV
jgi:membrane-associated phospholipid phosphatase